MVRLLSYSFSFLHSILILFVAVLFPLFCCAQTDADDGYGKFTFSGQLSAAAHYGYSYFDKSDSHAANAKVRYLPQINYETTLNGHGVFDLEFSANVLANFAFNSDGFSLKDKPDTKWYVNGRIWPYRAWLRYSNNSLEVRLGLQKINFGSAQLLRPLMWFDSLDPRDPIQFTEGVWAGLFRYYFKNNANLWFWALTGNDSRKGWELTPNSKLFSPEFGGRFQMPVVVGEAALTVHYRQSTEVPVFSSLNGFPSVSYIDTDEFRVGLDAKVDVGVGLCIESTYQRMFKRVGAFTNQLMVNVGVDYTFGIGNGLMVDLEHLVYVSGDTKLDEVRNITALMATYPVGMFDMFSLIGMYGWENNDWHLYFGWKRSFDALSLNVNAFWNSKVSVLSNSMPGNVIGVNKDALGLQFILIFDHSVDKVWNYKK